MLSNGSPVTGGKQEIRIYNDYTFKTKKVLKVGLYDVVYQLIQKAGVLICYSKHRRMIFLDISKNFALVRQIKNVEHVPCLSASPYPKVYVAVIQYIRTYFAWLHIK